MSTIGLLDWDMTFWQQPAVFNLELMQYAAKHKQSRDIVQMIHSFDDMRYSKIIVSKDYEDDYYPKDIFNHPKTKNIGLVYTNGIYKPDPYIEGVIPDASVYEKMERYYQINQGSQFRFKSMLVSPHLRLSRDGKTMKKNWEYQLSKCTPGKTLSWIVHDKEPHKIKDAPQEIRRVIAKFNRAGQRVGFKYPIEIWTDEDFKEWGSVRKLKYMSNMKLHKFIDNELLVEVAQIGGPMVIEYQLKDLNVTNELVVDLLKQALFLREHRSKMLLNIEGDIRSKRLLCKFFELLNEYTTRCHESYEDLTVYEYTKRFSRWLKADIIELYQYLRESNYPLFQLLYECLYVDYKNGIFENRYKWR